MQAQVRERQERRSPRILWRTPVFVIWEAQAGMKVREQAETEIVNAHGALLRLQGPLPSGKALQLLNPQNHQSLAARVVWRDPGPGEETRMGVELSPPSETFWGLYLRIPSAGGVS